MKYNDISPIEFLDRIEAIIPFMDIISTTNTGMRKIYIPESEEFLYYVMSDSTDSSVGTLMYQLNHGSVKPNFHLQSYNYSTISGLHNKNPFFTYNSFSDEWCKANSIYDNIGIKIPDISTVTEDYIFQKSLVLTEVQSYAEILFAHAKNRGMQSFMTSLSSLIYFEEKYNGN